MYELGSHMVDAVVRLLGKPDRVTPYLYTHGGYGDSFKDNTLAVLEYPRTIATISAGGKPWHSSFSWGTAVSHTSWDNVMSPIVYPFQRSPGECLDCCFRNHAPGCNSDPGYT